jgi:cell wall-associated NlpC family hydrolase
MPRNIAVTREEAVARALSVVNQPCRYKLGAGGRDPSKPYPWNEQRECDCTGYLAWVLGLDRYMEENPWYVRQNGGWLESTAIVRDCAAPYGIFARGERRTARPGDVLAWGDHGGRQGHVGIIVGRSADGYALRVAHCSSGNQILSENRTAIRVGDDSMWWVRPSVVAVFAGFAAAEEVA